MFMAKKLNWDFTVHKKWLREIEALEKIRQNVHIVAMHDAWINHFKHNAVIVIDWCNASNLDSYLDKKEKEPENSIEESIVWSLIA